MARMATSNTKKWHSPPSMNFVSCSKAISIKRILSRGQRRDLEGVIQLFDSLGVRFPKTRLSAEATIQKIMETQQRILKVIRHRFLPHLYSSTESSQFFLRTIRGGDIKKLISGLYTGKSALTIRPDLYPLVISMRSIPNRPPSSIG